MSICKEEVPETCQTITHCWSTAYCGQLCPRVAKEDEKELLSILILQSKTLGIRCSVFNNLHIVQFYRQKYGHVGIRVLCLQCFGHAGALFGARNQLGRGWEELKKADLQRAQGSHV